MCVCLYAFSIKLVYFNDFIKIAFYQCNSKIDFDTTHNTMIITICEWSHNGDRLIHVLRFYIIFEIF